MTIEVKTENDIALEEELRQERRLYNEAIQEYPLESLIESFVERLSQIFMRRVFHVRTIC